MGVSTDSDGEEDNWNSQSEPSTSPCSDVPEKDGKFIYVLVDLFFSCLFSRLNEWNWIDFGDSYFIYSW